MPACVCPAFTRLGQPCPGDIVSNGTMDHLTIASLLEAAGIVNGTLDSTLDTTDTSAHRTVPSRGLYCVCAAVVRRVDLTAVRHPATRVLVVVCREHSTCVGHGADC